MEDKKTLKNEELEKVTGGTNSDELHDDSSTNKEELEEHINIIDRLRENTDGRVIYP